MRLLQITDCHLHADPMARSRVGVPHRQLEAVVEAAARLEPDRVLVTGDVSQDQTPASYKLAARSLSRLDPDWCWLPGNHDDPVRMAECRPFPASLALGDWRLLLLDTQVIGQEGGALGAARRAALAEQLADDARPTLVAMHHPPLAVGAAWLDALGLADGEAFWEVLAGHAQVKAVLCGHIHQAFLGHGPNGVPVYGCPATSDQFLPGAETFAVDATARPGFRVVDLARDSLTTWVERIDF